MDFLFHFVFYFFFGCVSISEGWPTRLYFFIFSLYCSIPPSVIVFLFPFVSEMGFCRVGIQVSCDKKKGKRSVVNFGYSNDFFLPGSFVLFLAFSSGLSIP